MDETNQLSFMCEQFQKMRHKSLVLMTLCALVITSWMFLCQNTLSQLLIPQVKLVDVLAQQEIHSVQSDAPSLKVSPIPKEIAQKTPKSIPNAEPLSTKYLFLILSSPGNSALRSTLRSSGWLSHPWAHNGTIHGVHNGTIHGVHNGTIHGVHNGTIQFRYYFVTSRISPGKVHPDFYTFGKNF